MAARQPRMVLQMLTGTGTTRDLHHMPPFLGGLHSLVNPSISRISRNHPTAVGFRSFVTWWGMNDFFQGNSGTFSLVGFELEDGNRGFAWLCRHFLAMDVTHWDHGVGRVLMAQIVAHCTYFMARAHFSV